MKTKPTAAQNAARKFRRGQSFGPDAVCFFCPYCNPIALMMIDKTLLEEHHVVGANHNDAMRVPVCRNCHAELTAGYLDHGVSMRKQKSTPERLAEVNRALEVFHRAASATHGNSATELDEHTARLDRNYPDWREME